MTDQDTFLRTIIENPDDDTPRLVFADWLEENGDPERAEFILRELILGPMLKELRKLDLSFCNITSAGARLLANQELHPDLRLDLTGNPIDKDCLSALTGRFGSRVRFATTG